MALPSTVCPYVGLQPYTDADAAYFFGRERDQRIIAANLYAAPLTVLYGGSGVGKSSVLMAGVVPRLRAEPRTAVVVFREWQGDSFLAALKSKCCAAVAEAQGKPLSIDLSLPLDDLLYAAAEAFGGSILILFDQFEEYFLYHPESQAGNSFDTEFARAVNRDEVQASFLIALRDDGLAKLDRFRARIPNLLGNMLRLQPLDSAGAEEAIRKPLAVYNNVVGTPAPSVEIEDELVREIVLEVRSGKVLLSKSAGVGQTHARSASDEVETPFLQLVLTRLWDEEMRAGSHVLRLSTLQRLGGAQNIVRTHLDGVMEKLDAMQREVCSRFFDRLVTPSGAKIACSVDDLTRWARDLAAHVPAVLKNLSDNRILRSVAAPDPHAAPLCEIFHDVLAPAVLDWRTRYEQAAAEKRAAEEASAAAKEATQVRELEQAQALAAEQQRRMEEQASSAARQRWFLVVLSVLLLFAVTAASLAVRQWQQADRARRDAIAAESKAAVEAQNAQAEARRANSRQLAAQALSRVDDRLDLALLLGLEAYRTDPSFEARSSLLTPLEYNPRVRTFLRGHTAAVSSVAFSPDGKSIASGSRDQSIRLWDLSTLNPHGAPLEVPRYSGGDVVVAFSPDGRTLASGSSGVAIGLWDLTVEQPSYKRVVGPARGGGPVSSLAFDPARGVLVSASCAGNQWHCSSSGVQGWNLAPGTPTINGFSARAGVVETVAVGTNGRLLAAGSDDIRVKVWDVATGKEIEMPATGHTSSITSVAFSADGHLLASASKDKSIIIWDVDRQRAADVPLRGHKDEVWSVAFSPDGRTLASGSSDSTILLWDVATHGTLGPPVAHGSGVTSLVFSPDGKSLLSGGMDGSVVLWDLALRLHSDTGSVLGIAFSPDSQVLVAGGDHDETVIPWNVHSGQPIATPRLGYGGVSSVAFSRNGQVLASANFSGSIALWDTTTWRQIGEPLRQHKERATGVTFSPDGKMLASGSVDNTVVLGDVATRQPIGEPLMAHGAPVTSVAFSPDGRTLASGSLGRGKTEEEEKKPDVNIVLWDVATRSPALLALSSGVSAIAFDPTGATLASASLDNAIVTWDVLTHQRVGPALTGHRSSINSVAYSPNGSTLASASRDGTILWDMAKRRSLGLPLAGHTDAVNMAVFSPDGDTLASCSDDHTIVLRDVSFLKDSSLDSLQARVCRIVRRNLTLEEWKQYFGDEKYRPTCPEFQGLPEPAAAPTEG